MEKPARNTICLWFDGEPKRRHSSMRGPFPIHLPAIHRAPGDFPSGKAGEVLTVAFTVLGIPWLGLNGGPTSKHSEAYSFQLATFGHAETDRYRDAIVGNGGQERAFDAMTQMTKIDIAAIESACRA